MSGMQSAKHRLPCLGLHCRLGCTKSYMGWGFLRPGTKCRPRLPDEDSELQAYQRCQVNTAESSLILTEPYFNLPNIQEVYDQFVFEEYEFNSYYRCTRECFGHNVSGSVLLFSTVCSSCLVDPFRDTFRYTKSTFPRMHGNSRFGVQFHACHSNTRRKYYLGCSQAVGITCDYSKGHSLTAL